MEICRPFLDVVCAFGVKSSDDERVNLGFRSDASRENSPNEPHGQPLSLSDLSPLMQYKTMLLTDSESEICYNILYMEKHNRALRDSWSLRQMGVYHQLGTEVKSSRWIILNPAGHVQTRLESLLQTGSHQCQMAFHCEFLSMLSSNWTIYIEDLNLEWRRYVSHRFMFVTWNRLTGGVG
jgi:hypothetical protein